VLAKDVGGLLGYTLSLEYEGDVDQIAAPPGWTTMDSRAEQGTLNVVAAGAVPLSGDATLLEVILHPSAQDESWRHPAIGGILLNDGQIPAEVVGGDGAAEGQAHE
jgi:hypothetical protein